VVNIVICIAWLGNRSLGGVSGTPRCSGVEDIGCGHSILDILSVQNEHIMYEGGLGEAILMKLLHNVMM